MLDALAVFKSMGILSEFLFGETGGLELRHCCSLGWTLVLLSILKKIVEKTIKRADISIANR